jgi:SAM-dependent methyltransferase
MDPVNSLDDALNLSKEKALESWARRVRENREQAERFREAPEKPDFYAPTASIFKMDPHRDDEEALQILRSKVQPGEVWLDIGAGGGRNALPLALLAREVIAVEPSDAMLSILRGSMREHGISNIQIIQGRWPVKDSPGADVALISHVSYDIEDIGAFLDAMEASAGRLCIAVLLDAAPASAANLFWPRIHGEKRTPLPALREFLTLQLARERLCEVRLTARDTPSHSNREMMLPFLRQQLFIEAGGKKDQLLKQLLEEQATQRNGRFSLNWQPGQVGIVSWKTR